MRMTPEQEQAMNYIKQKQAQDPNYDPSKDPQYQQMMMQLIPAEIRDISSGIERLKVAFKDATEGLLFIYLVVYLSIICSPLYIYIIQV